MCVTDCWFDDFQTGPRACLGDRQTITCNLLFTPERSERKEFGRNVLHLGFTQPIFPTNDPTRRAHRFSSCHS